MRQTSENMMKQILHDSLEQELSRVPSEEKIQKQHVLSRRFEEKMEWIIKNQNRVTDFTSKDSAVSEDVRNKRKRKKLLAACIACFLVFGAAMGTWKTFFTPKGASDLAQTAGSTEKSQQDQQGSENSESAADLAGENGGIMTEEAVSGEVRMVMMEGKLYKDTGEISSIPRCGTADFTLDSSVDQGLPSENGQTNFGAGYEGQWGMRWNRIEIRIHDVWHIFAYQENDLENVWMTVTNENAVSAEVILENQSDQLIWYGEPYSLEAFQEETSTWIPVEEKYEDVWNDLGYDLYAGKTSQWSVNWSERYGELKPGTYRIVKSFYVGQEAGEVSEHTMLAEFTIEDHR